MSTRIGDVMEGGEEGCKRGRWGWTNNGGGQINLSERGQINLSEDKYNKLDRKGSP
jgi:hypothetical protein